MMRTKRLAPRSGAMRLRIAVAVVAGILFAIVPAVQAYCAYCSIDLPVGAPAALVAAETGDADHDASCCDALPEVAVDDRVSFKDDAPLGRKLPVLALTLASGTAAPVFAAAPRRTWCDLPPPEPAFRRLPRLLL